MVVAVHRGGDVELAAAPREVARRAEDRVRGIVGVGNPVTVRVQSPAGPGRRHELHPADGPGGARPEVLAEIGLDLVDGGEDLPRNAVGVPGRLPDAAEGSERHRPGRPLAERDRRTVGRERRDVSAAARVRSHNAERVRGRGTRESQHQHSPEEREDAFHGYCWPATRSLGSSVGSAGSSGTSSAGLSGSAASSESGRDSSCAATFAACSLSARSSAMRKS